MFRGNNAHDHDEFEDEEIEGGEEEEEEDDPADIERQFREQRARVRTCVDLDELRRLRSNLRHAVSARTVQGIARVRASDLIELIDDRITDIKAKQIADRRS